jgi:hypothetical protein
VKLTHASNHGLACFLIRANPECGIFFRQRHQGFGEFLHITFGLGLNRHGNHRFWDEQRLENNGFIG